jgi:hypothetical protein
VVVEPASSEGVYAWIQGGPRLLAAEQGKAPGRLDLRAEFVEALLRAIPKTDAFVLSLSFLGAFPRRSLALWEARFTRTLEARGVSGDRYLIYMRSPTRGEQLPGAESGYLGAPPERRADIALYRTGPDDSRSVRKNSCLRKGARYRLRVLIGKPQEGSLMTTPPPAIDRLLPPPRGDRYELAVMVNGEDFTVLDVSTARLSLPLHGASAPVDFGIAAPERVGPARLYVAIAYQGNVLQSFVLHAQIDAAETSRAGETLLYVELLFSNTARFGNLDALRERALSIGVGDPRPGDTTPLRLAGGTSSVSIRLAELMTASQTAEYRRILEEATLDAGKGPRFLAYPSEQNPQRPGAEEILRKLAILGGNLYRGFYLQADAVQPALDALTGSEDRTIQIVRYQATQTFPWAALYDFPEPEEVVGRPAPVCLGYGPRTHPDKEPPRCACPSPDLWCARGFWGIRHRIEELIGTSSLEDAVLTVERSADMAPVGLALGTRDRPVEDMRAKVNQLVAPEAAVDFDLEKNLLESLWRSDRPALLVVLGHMAIADAAGEPRGPRLILHPGKAWLQDRKVIDFRRAHGRWSQPRSLVMVLACAAGATEPATVTDFMLAFHNAGAGAVIGTECTVFSGLLSRFAAEVTGSLLEGASLGAALTGFRRRLLSERNPLGFVFNALGNADLTLTPP